MTPVLTVCEVSQIIKNLFDSNEVLKKVYIKGEISNFKHHLSGHMYFTLKDDRAQIRCIMFKNYNMLLPFLPENGMKVLVLGYISVFIKAGQYQVYVEEIQPDGLGALHLAFEKLKIKLEKEGLFGQENKKEIPFLPKKIGLVTSLTGAAVRDILTVIKRRFGNVNIIITPVRVQGRGAAEEICNGISDLNRIKDIDVIIVSRGGGSIEELWSFNEEKVARAIFNSNIPVISAVGHETDYTIADFVSDKRAPTPSAAAEMVIPEKTVLKKQLTNLGLRLVNAIKSYVDIRRQKLEYIKRSPTFTRPKSLINNHRLILDHMSKILNKEMWSILYDKKSCFQSVVAKLKALNPTAILHRGYSICVNLRDNKVIKKLGDANDKIRVIICDGILICDVKEKIKKR
ncbi:MAG TPA: exodeoxyribonuclease VII large subunit [Thermoanaerobacterales bacterium]|nr:exodeoxyribonuclease VII large subunit [Thermoanaerobacterales bacterium]